MGGLHPRGTIDGADWPDRVMVTGRVAGEPRDPRERYTVIPVATRRRPASPSPVLVALLSAVFLAGTAAVFMPGDAFAATTTKVAACGASLRTSSSTTARLKATIRAGARVTVTATVRGGAWRATCAGATLSGRYWYRISVVDGRSVRSRYGVSYVYAGAWLFNYPTPSPRFAACNGVGLRLGTSFSTTRKGVLKAGSQVSVTALIGGAGWRATCNGAVLSGSYWFRVKAINGVSVRSLYGISYVYVASKLISVTDPTKATVTEGIDVSHWQGTIVWPAVKAAGKEFAFMKASQGTTFVDSTYQTNRVNARAAGIRIGAYHFADPDATPGDAVAEADHFLDAAQPSSGELLPVLDLEQAGGLAVPDLQAWVKAYMGRIYQRTGLRSVIYVSPAFWAKYMGDTNWFALNGYKVLWIAHWTTAPSPWVPGQTWGGNNWTFWQYTSSGSVPGISGRVDLDRYNGWDFSRVLIP